MGKKITILASIFIMVASSLKSQNYVWAKSLAGTDMDQGKSVAVDASGNVFTTGTFRGTVDFDPGAGSASLTSAGSDDMFISKLDASGNYVWAYAFGGPNPADEGRAVVTDGSGNVYIAGLFSGTTIDFDQSAGTASLSSANPGAFLLKLSSSGSFVSVKGFTAGVGSSCGVYSMANDASGNIYISGYFSGTIDFDPGAGTTTLSAGAISKTFTLKLNSSGNFVWVKAIGDATGNNYDGYEIAVDGSGNVYTTGRFGGTLDFDPGATTFTLFSPNSDTYISKLDASGNFLWAKNFRASNGFGIAVDASSNVITTGYFTGTVDFDPGPGTSTISSAASSADIFISKLDASGNFVWIKVISGTGSDKGSSIAVDGSGNLYATGFFQLSPDFDPGPGVATLNAVGGGATDVFVLKLNASGNYLWATSFGSSSNDQGNKICLGSSGIAHVTGVFNGTVNASSGTPNFSYLGSTDLFVAKLCSASLSTTASSSLICSGNTVTLSVGGASSYTWYPGASVGTSSVVSPTITTSYSVVGNNTTGCVGTNTIILTITVSPIPSLSVNSGTICNGSVFTMVPSGASSYSVNGAGATNFTFNPTSSTNYTITGANAPGCSSSNTVVSAVTVYTTPVISVNSGSVCMGSVFTASPAGASNYSVNGLSATNFTFNPISSTNYSITGKSALGCTASNTAVLAVTVNSLPIVSIMGPPPAVPVCAGQSVPLLANGANTYTWSNLSGTVSTSSSPNLTPSTSTTYSLVCKSAAGCLSLPASSLITVVSGPTLSVNHPSVCSGQNAILTPSGSLSYTLFPLPFPFTNTISVFQPSISGTYNYIVIGQSINGCTSSITSTVTVSGTPFVTVNNPTLCKYSTADNVALIANGATSYTWSSGGSGATVFVVPSPTIQTYTVTGATNGCTAVAISTVISEDFPFIVSSNWTFCGAGLTTFTAPFVGLQSYSWSTGATTQTTTINLPSTPTVISMSGLGIACTRGYSWNINPSPLFSNSLSITGNSNVCLGSAVTLSLNPGLLGPNNGSTTAWSTGASGNSINISPTVSGIYSASVITYTNTGGFTSVSPTLGCINTGTFALIVTPIPTISVTSSGSVICNTQTVSLNGLGATTYSWQPGTLTGTSVVINPSVTTTYSVYGSSSGCASSNTAVTTITVNARPLISVNGGSVCAGKTFTMIPSGANTYSVNGISTTNFTFNPVSSATYSVTGTGLSGCLSSNTVISAVTVYSLPLVSANSGSVCSGTIFTLLPSGASTYSVNGLATANFTFNPASTTNYSITGSSSLGCVSSNTAVSAVTVYSLPVVSVNNSTICSGTVYTMNPSGAVTYSVNGTSISNFTFNPASSTNYSLTGLNSFGCLSSNIAIASVSVKASPTLAVNNATICSGNTVAISPSGTGVTSYSITGGNYTVSPVSNTNYSVTGTGTNGCLSSNTAVAFVSVNITPSIIVNSGATCAGNPVVITPTATGISAFNITGGTFTVNPSGNTSYSVTGTGTNGCVSSNTAVSSITVNTTPSISVNSATICSGNSVVITPTAVGINSFNISSGNFTVSPASNNTYSITGTGTNGCASSNTAIANITVKTTPTITVNNATICSGNLVVISPTANGISAFNISGGNFTVSPLSSTNYSVTGTGTNGCVSSNTAVSLITVNTTPIISVNSATICSGNSVIITPSAAGISVFNISGGNFTVSPVSNTNYSVTGTGTNGCVSSNTAVSSITVNTTPSISVNSATICSGNSVVISPTATGISAFNISGGNFTVSPVSNTIYSVTGTGTNGCVSSNTAVSTVLVYSLPLIGASNGAICPGGSYTIIPSGASTYSYSGGTNVVSPSATTTYSVYGTDANGCISANPAILTVSVVNTISLSINGPTVICLGNTASLTGSGATTFSWNTGATTNTIVLSPNATTGYTLIGSSGNCSSTAFITLSVNPLPTITVNSGSICSGSSFSINPAGAINYSISGGSFTVNPAASSTYTITGTNQNGCQSSAVSNVAVNGLPQIGVNSGSICNGSSFTILPSGASSYTVSGGTLTVNPGSSTNYTINGTDINGCVGEAISSVTVNSNPTVVLTSNSNTICSGETVTIQASGASSYLWSGGETSPFIIVAPVTTTNYAVTGTDSRGCTNTFTLSQHVDMCSGLAETSSSKIQVNIYPNPTKGLIYIDINSQGLLYVNNSLGTLLLMLELSPGKNAVPLKDFAHGVYFMKIVKGGHQQIFRIIKE